MCLAQLAQQGVHADAGQGVQGAERFVGEQQLRFADQRARERGPLLLTPGQLVRPRAFPPGESDLLERLPATVGGVRAAQPEGHVVQDPLPGQQPGVLEDHRHLLRYGDPPVPGDVAVQAREGPQQGALAGAGAADQGDELAGGDVQVESVEDPAVRVEAAVQVADADREFGGQPSSVCRHASAFLPVRRTALSAQ
nr:hypothetical protein GCM10020092_040470 [Actinoplanes digitatis]